MVAVSRNVMSGNDVGAGNTRRDTVGTVDGVVVCGVFVAVFVAVFMAVFMAVLVTGSDGGEPMVAERFMS